MDLLLIGVVALVVLVAVVVGLLVGFRFGWHDGYTAGSDAATPLRRGHWADLERGVFDYPEVV